MNQEQFIIPNNALLPNLINYLNRHAGNSNTTIVAGPPGPPGKDGISVVDAEVSNPTGELLLILSNGDIIEAGDVAGPPGPPGPPGPSSSFVTTKTITEDYNVSIDDYYIGVNAKKPVTIFLPNLTVSKQIIIKLQYGPPVGNRKVTIDGSGKLIDDQNTYVMQNPFEYVNLVFNNLEDCWYIV